MAYSSSDCYITYPKIDSIKQYLKSEDYLIKKDNAIVGDFLESNSNLLIVNTVSGYDVYQDVKHFYSENEVIKLNDGKNTNQLVDIDSKAVFGYLSDMEDKNILSYCPTRNSSKKSTSYYIKNGDDLLYITIDNGNLSNLNKDGLKNQYEFLKLFEKHIGKVKID